MKTKLTYTLIAACSLTPMASAVASALYPGNVSSERVEESAEQADQQRHELNPEVTSLDSVKVTARRVSEDLVDVPAVIDVLSSEDLRRRGVKTDRDLQSAVPGLVIRTSGSANFLSYVIRGASLDQYSGSVPGVQPYVNEVPIAPNAALSFFDLEGVQVLKGPQGTLFGRNLTGGAVLYQTAQPSPDKHGYASFQVGNFGRTAIEAASNIPINETSALRIAANHTNGGAFVTNLYDDKKYGDQNNKSLRVSLKLQPSESFTSVTTIEHTQSTGTNQPQYPYFVLPCGTPGGQPSCDLHPSVPAFQELIGSQSGTYFPDYPNGYVFPGGLAELQSFLESQGDYVVNQNGKFPHNSEFTYLTNSSSYELSPSLTFKNIFGYASSDAEDGFDNDATPYPIIEDGPGMGGGTETYRAKVKQISNEFQIQGTTLQGAARYIVGAFYNNTESQFDSAIRQVLIFQPETIVPIEYRFNGFMLDESYALFTQWTFANSDRLNTTAGVRYTWDKLTTYHLPDSIFYAGDSRQTAWQSEPSWTLSLDYQINPSTMIYATTRGSWRVGGHNLFAPPVGRKITANMGGNYFLPEKVRDVEAGLKFDGRLGGKPVQLNFAAYQQWLKDVQKVGLGVIEGTSASATVTVPSAEVKGIEASGQIRVSRSLLLGFQAALTDAQFKDNIGYLYGVPAEFGPYADAPKQSGSIFARLDVPLAESAGELSFQFDVYGQSSFYFSNRANTFDPGTLLPGYGLVNVRADWNRPLGLEPVTISLFLKNAFDRMYYTGGAPGAQVAGLVSSTYGLPRTYGLSLRVDW